MFKKSLVAALAVTASFAIATGANAQTAPHVISIAGTPDHITFQPQDDAITINEGDTAHIVVNVHRETGRNNYVLIVTFSGCGVDAVASPGSFTITYANVDVLDQEIAFDVSGLDPGVCSIGFGTEINGAPYQENDVVLVTVNALPDTTVPDTTVPETTTTLAGTTTTAQAQQPIVDAGSESGPMALTALGLMLLGGVTIAATRRRTAL